MFSFFLCFFFSFAYSFDGLGRVQEKGLVRAQRKPSKNQPRMLRVWVQNYNMCKNGGLNTSWFDSVMANGTDKCLEWRRNVIRRAFWIRVGGWMEGGLLNASSFLPGTLYALLKYVQRPAHAFARTYVSLYHSVLLVRTTVYTLAYLLNLGAGYRKILVALSQGKEIESLPHH